MPAQLDGSVSVVVVVFNPGQELVDLAESLEQATRSRVDLVLVNNGARNAVIDAVEAGSRARVLDPGGNVGYGAGINFGLRHTTGEWVVAANPDLVFSPGSLDVLLSVAAASPRAGALGPCLLNSDGSIYPSAREVPAIVQGTAHALLVRVWPRNPWSAAYRQSGTAGTGETRTAGWLSGACLVLRRAALDEVGGFDEDYFMFFEDLDLGERLGKHGWSNLYVPSALVTHVQGVSWKQKPARMISAHHASARLYVSKKYPHWYQAPLRGVLSLGLHARERIQVRGATR